MSRLWGIITLIFIGFIIMGILLHAGSFASAAGTLFSGVSGLGQTLEGQQAAGAGGSGTGSG